MKNKWFLHLIAALFTALLLTGCADDNDPAPEEDQSNHEHEHEQENNQLDENAIDNPTEDETGEEADKTE